jgi:amidase
MASSNYHRRDFLRLGAAFTAAGLVPREFLATPSQQLNLEEAGVFDLSTRIASGELTARSLTEQYLQRIESIDRSGPRINCVIETNPDALEIADRLDADRRGGRLRGRMHGIPVLIKDNIGTADKMQTTAGSLALMDARPTADSHIVGRLREAGCVIIGKTNLSEWANFRSSHSTSGWSGRGGLCRNPYALDRNTSGSSSGSGGAGAAALATVTVGTETDGSIVSPSNSCGLVGLKPTIGLVSRTGIIPISHTQDTSGPMTRSVYDAAALLTVLAGSDPGDTATARADVQRSRDYTSFLKNEKLTGLRIGVVREQLMGYNTHADRIAEDALKALKELGATIIDPVKPPASSERAGQGRVRGDALRVQGRTGEVFRRGERAGEDPGGPARVQREESRPRDALLRPGNRRDGDEEGPADDARVSHRARHVPSHRAHRGEST